ncbi:MAG: FeoB-associated Cys-rich membrane protein [Opitutaceae bacterium]|nr:FeoB-associated Cys-rich membrane protein [Opitutaceae bacterium]
MSAEFQTIAALVVVALAATWLIARAWRKHRNPGCGGDCGCPTDKLKR